MKKKILSLALLAALFATGCGNTSESNTANPDTTAKPTETATQPAETITEEPLPETMTITGAKLVSVSETVTLTANVANATWTSSDETVATVAGGVVTGAKAGTATITASYSTLSATFEVTVLDNIGSTLNKENKTEVHVKGQVAAADNYGFILTDIHNYVYVYASGHGLEAGEYIDFQGTVAFDSTKNYVYELKPNSTSVKGDDNKYTTTITGITRLTEGDYETIVPTYEATAYDEASLNAMTYAQGAVYATMIGEVKSGNVFVGDTKIKISNGTIENGYYNITCYVYKNNNAYYMYQVSSSVTARPAATTLTITNGATATIYAGNPIQLEVKQAPSGAADELTYTSSNTATATVSETGLVTLTDAAKANDTFTVTVASKTTTSVNATITFTVGDSSSVTSQSVELDVFASNFTKDSTDAKIATYTKGIVAFELNKNTSKTDNRLTDTDHLRIYAGAKFTVSVEGHDIETIVYTNSATSNMLSSSSATFTGATFDGDTLTATASEGVQSVSFVTSSQVRIKKIVVTYKL